MPTELLRETSLPIDMVAEETGFLTGFFFPGNFYRNTRISPARYRAKMVPRYSELNSKNLR